MESKSNEEQEQQKCTCGREELKPMVSQTRNPDPEPFSFKFIGPGSPEAMKDAIARLREMVN